MSSINQSTLLSLIEKNTFSWIDTFINKDLTKDLNLDDNGMIKIDNGDLVTPEEYLFSINQKDELKIQNIERIKERLSYKLSQLLKRESTFTEQSLFDAVSKDKEIKQTAENAEIIKKAALAYGSQIPVYGTKVHIDEGQENSELNQIVHLGPREFGLFTTKKTLNEELELIDLLLDVNQNHVFKCDHDIVNECINNNLYISGQQIAAVRACTESISQTSGCFGLAGAGKSTTMATVATIYRKLGYTPVGIALSWLAAKVLEIETSMPCFSVKSFIDEKSSMENGFEQKTVVFVDEAGLVNVEDLRTILRIIKKSKLPVKLILSGDPTQLNPINGSNALELVEKILPRHAQAEINEIRRQSSRSHREAVKLLRDGRSGEALYLFNQQEAIQIKNNQAEMIQQVVEDYFTALKENPDPNYKILTIAMNHAVIHELNQKIRALMIEFGRVDKSTEITIPVSRKSQANRALPKEESFAVGDRIIFLQNDKSNYLKDVNTDKEYKVFLSNNTVGTIADIKNDGQNGHNIRVHIEIEDDDRQKVMAYVDINTKKYVKYNPNNNSAMECAIGLNYATTAYASQGQTVQHCLFLDDGAGMMNRRYAYVVCSRHKEKLSVYINREKITQEILNKRTRSDDEKDSDKTLIISNITILNQVARNWGKPDNRKSVVVKFLDMLDDLKEMKYKFNMFPESKNLDIHNLPSNFNELYMIYKIKKNTIEKEKYYYQPPKDKSIILLDTPEYYKTRPNKVDINFKQDLSNVETRTSYSFDVLPVLDKKEYVLSDILNDDLFKALKGEFFDIGRGGEIRFIAKTREKNSNHIILSKYDLFGKDTLNTGYPFFVSGGEDSINNNKILICQDINHFLLYFKEYYLDNKDHTYAPTIIWGAQDTHYEHILKRFDNSNVFILGDDDYKEQQKNKILYCVDGYQVHNIQFAHDNHKVQNGLNDLTDNINIDLSSLDLSMDEQQEHDAIHNHNDLVDSCGNLDVDLLQFYLKNNQILTDEQFENHVLPSKLQTIQNEEQEILDMEAEEDKNTDYNHPDGALPSHVVQALHNNTIATEQEQQYQDNTVYVGDEHSYSYNYGYNNYNVVMPDFAPVELEMPEYMVENAIPVEVGQTPVQEPEPMQVQLNEPSQSNKNTSKFKM